MHVLVVGGDAVGDRLEQERLARFGRRDDQAALAAPDRGDQVEQARGEDGRGRLKVDQLHREDRRQLVEVGPPPGGLRVDAVDRLDAQHAEELLVVLRRPHVAGDAVPGAQPEAPDLRLRDVDVLLARQQPLAAQEAEAVLDDLEDPLAVDVALLLGLGLQDAVDEVVALVARVAGDAERARDLLQLLRRFRLEFGDRDRRGELARLAFGRRGRRRGRLGLRWPAVRSRLGWRCRGRHQSGLCKQWCFSWGWCGLWGARRRPRLEGFRGPVAVRTGAPAARRGRRGVERHRRRRLLARPVAVGGHASCDCPARRRARSGPPLRCVAHRPPLFSTRLSGVQRSKSRSRMLPAANRVAIVLSPRG